MLSSNYKFYSPSALGVVSLLITTRNILNIYSLFEHIYISSLTDPKVDPNYNVETKKRFESNKYKIYGLLVGSALSTVAFFTNKHADQLDKSKISSCFLIVASVLSSTLVYYMPNMMHSNHSNHK